MGNDKKDLYLFLSMLIGGMIIASGSNYLYEILNITPRIIFRTLLILHFFFLIDSFDTREAKRNLWEIVSYSKKDRVVFLSWLFSGTFTLVYLGLLIPKLNWVYMLFFLVALFGGAPYILIVFSSLEIREELKEKFKLRKQEN
jgi:hypothetical protein